MMPNEPGPLLGQRSLLVLALAAICGACAAFLILRTHCFPEVALLTGASSFAGAVIFLNAIVER